MIGLIKWLKKMFKNILQNLAELFGTGLAPGREEVDLKRRLPDGRDYMSVRTSRGGINMPKRQPCPVCCSSSKREYKTLGGARYRCCKHGTFFIRR